MTEKKTAVAKREPTISEKFTNTVIREFGTTISDSVDMMPYQRHLAQNLFVKIDAALKAAELKRTGDRQPIVWANINMNKLAIDAVHRVNLGLDALIDNHVHPIPYWNSKEGKYDLDLRIGYIGKDFYRRRMAVEEPKAIIYELVYSTDKFKPIKRTLNNAVESYEFEITQPFDRGEIIGGFGYIVYGDSSKNQLVIVSEKDFQKSKALAKTQDFWNKSPVEMRFKTLVLRVTEKLQVDPKKVNQSYLVVEATDDETTEAVMAVEIEENANKDLLDVDPRTGEITEGVVDDGEITKSVEPESKPPKESSKPKRNPKSIKTMGELTKACFEDFGMQPARVWTELGVSGQSDIAETPDVCYTRIAAVMAGPKEEPQEKPQEGPGW